MTLTLLKNAMSESRRRSSIDGVENPAEIEYIKAGKYEPGERQNSRGDLDAVGPVELKGKMVDKQHEYENGVGISVSCVVMRNCGEVVKRRGK
jgi:hypothetical protein